MRIDCEIEGFEGCFIEIEEKWTRGEIKRFWGAAVGGDDEAHDLLVSKTKSMHLVTADGLDLDDPDDLTDSNMDQLDYTLYIWLSTAFGIGINRLQQLVKKSALTSFDTSAAKK